MTLSALEPLADQHCLDAFDSGEASLDDWLRRRARANQISGATRTFVAVEDGAVAAYYALASGSIGVAASPGSFRRNMPDPSPVVILGRLAIDRRQQGQGIGRALVRDAAKRVITAAEIIGVRGLIAHAISDEARGFYLALGFQASPLQPMTMFVAVSALAASL